MVDAISPPTAAASAVVFIPATYPFLADFGLDPVVMFWGLVGVVVSQTLLRNTANGWKAIAGLATGSMFVAAVGTPLLIAYGVNNLPGDWAWLAKVSDLHMKVAIATILGGAAQPLLIKTVGRFLPSTVPVPPVAVKE